MTEGETGMEKENRLRMETDLGGEMMDEDDAREREGKGGYRERKRHGGNGSGGDRETGGVGGDPDKQC